MTFKEAFEYSGKVAGSFEPDCCEHLWNAAIQTHGTMVEVGVHYGRSASLIVQAASVHGNKVILIDPWSDVTMYEEVRDRFARDFPEVETICLKMNSQDALLDLLQRKAIDSPLALVHIDAFHAIDENGYNHPWMDAQHWTPLLKRGGFACFHDYDPVIFPDIVRAVDHFTSHWKDLGTIGTLAIRQKP
jgi:predicted O-methyltransferase YrrM